MRVRPHPVPACHWIGGTVSLVPHHIQHLAWRHRPDRIYTGYIFDLDGTIYLGDGLLPGSRRLIETLRQRGTRILFLSNNPTNDPERYAAKLTRLGIPATPDEIVNTVFTMTRWLLEHHPEATVTYRALTRRVIARAATCSARASLLREARAAFKGTTRYEQRVHGVREVRIFVLEPAVS